MLLIGWALYITLVVGACYWLGKPSRAHRIFFVIVGTILILAPHWDVILGAPAMRRACREQGGLQKYEPVEFPLPSVLVAPGYEFQTSCLSCFDILIRGLARETQAEIRPYGRRSPLALTDESGFMKYWLASVGDPDCKAFEAAHDVGWLRIWTQAGVLYDGTSCIAARLIDAPTAAFELGGPVRRIWDDGVLRVLEGRVELRHASGQPIATLKHLRQLPWNRRVTYWGLPPVPSCPSRKNFARNVIEQERAQEMQSVAVYDRHKRLQTKRPEEVTASRHGNLPLTMNPAFLLLLLAGRAEGL